MKIRQGFISNSSTSSFVLAGIKLSKETTWEEIIINVLDITKEQIIERIRVDKDTISENIIEEKIRDVFSDELYNLRDKKGIWVLEGSEDGVPDEGIVVGKMIAELSSDNGEWSESEWSFPELTQELADILSKFKGCSEIKIFTGTRCC